MDCLTTVYRSLLSFGTSISHLPSCVSTHLVCVSSVCGPLSVRRLGFVLPTSGLCLHTIDVWWWRPGMFGPGVVSDLPTPIPPTSVLEDVSEGKTPVGVPLGGPLRVTYRDPWTSFDGSFDVSCTRPFLVKGVPTS